MFIESLKLSVLRCRCLCHSCRKPQYYSPSGSYHVLKKPKSKPKKIPKKSYASRTVTKHYMLSLCGHQFKIRKMKRGTGQGPSGVKRQIMIPSKKIDQKILIKIFAQFLKDVTIERIIDIIEMMQEALVKRIENYQKKKKSPPLPEGAYPTEEEEFSFESPRPSPAHFSKTDSDTSEKEFETPDHSPGTSISSASSISSIDSDYEQLKEHEQIMKPLVTASSQEGSRKLTDSEVADITKVFQSMVLDYTEEFVTNLFYKLEELDVVFFRKCLKEDVPEKRRNV